MWVKLPDIVVFTGGALAREIRVRAVRSGDDASGVAR